MADEPTADPDVYGKAAEDVRATAKWILGAFAAVGATAFAGLQLTSFGDLDPSRDQWRVPVAIAGFVVTLVGIAAAITTLGVFLSRKPLTLRRVVTGKSRDMKVVRESLAGDVTILGELPDVAALQQGIVENAATFTQANEYLASLDPAPASGPDPLVAERTQGSLARTQAQLNITDLQDIARQALGRAQLIVINRRYHRVLGWIVVWTTFAALGAVLFAWATGQPDLEEEPSRPRIDASVATEDGIRTLSVEVTVDGVDHGASGTVVAAWGDGEELFDGSFGENEGVASTKVSVVLPPERQGHIEIVATLTEDEETEASDPEVLTASLVIIASTVPTTTTTTAAVTTTTAAVTTTTMAGGD